MTDPRVIAALDLACMMQALMARRSALTTSEREKLQCYTVRSLAALNGNALPAGEKIDRETALAAFDVVLAALVNFGIPNADLVARFNRHALQRTH